jgi:hypothetical protein
VGKRLGICSGIVFTGNIAKRRPYD